MNSKTTQAINKIAEKIVGAAEMDDPTQVDAFRTEIVNACKSELVGFEPTVVLSKVAVKVEVKGTGGLNGYTLFSKKKRGSLNTEMGEETAKAFFIGECGVQKYIPKLWNALSVEEQAKWNAEAKEIREDTVVPEVPVGKTNLWHPFQKAFPAYLVAEKIVVPFTGLSTATGEKYRELKKQGAHAIVYFIAKYPPVPKGKKVASSTG